MKLKTLYDNASLAPWFDMLNHSPSNNAEFTYNSTDNCLYVQVSREILYGIVLINEAPDNWSKLERALN